jgi:hypothetical protein
MFDTHQAGQYDSVDLELAKMGLFLKIMMLAHMLRVHIARCEIFIITKRNLLILNPAESNL